MKKNMFISLCVLFTIFLAACGGTSGPDEGASPSNKVTLEALPTVDRSGTAILVPENIETIVSLAPSITQILEDLEVLDKVVAIDNNTPFYVENLDALPQVDIMTPNLEVLLSLNPDIVFASEISFGLNEEIFQILIDAGITVAKIPTSESISDIKLDVLFVANCLQLGDKGQTLVHTLQEDIDRIADIGRSITDQKTVLFEISPLPTIFSFGSGVFLNEMMELIGATNIFADQSGWLPVTEEVIIDANPDVILTNVNFIENPVGEILSRPGWQNVTAVENDAVYYIDNGASSLPNHRIVKALKEMAVAVYPEEFIHLVE